MKQWLNLVRGLSAANAHRRALRQAANDTLVVAAVHARRRADWPLYGLGVAMGVGLALLAGLGA